MAKTTLVAITFESDTMSKLDVVEEIRDMLEGKTVFGYASSAEIIAVDRRDA